MPTKVYIKSYEAVSVAGHGIDQIFKNLLNKKCLFIKDFDYMTEDGGLYMGTILDFDKAIEFCGAIAHEGVSVFESESAISALGAAIEELQGGKATEALVLDSYRLKREDILKLIDEGEYSQSIAKPFDYETDGLNVAETVTSILLTTEKTDIELVGFGLGADFYSAMDAALKNAQVAASDIDYIEAAAVGIPDEDKAEAEALAKMFAQKPIVSSSKGLTGYSFGASSLLSLIVAAKALLEGIVPASSFLEHSFTNEISFAYANKSKQLGKVLINSNEDENEYASLVIAKA